MSYRYRNLSRVIDRRNIAPAPAVENSVVRIDPVKDWPASRQLALMFCRKTEFVKTVSRRLEGTQLKAQRHDYRYLKAQDLITHFKTERYPHGLLVCTPQGAGIADTLAFHHAGELRMHLFKPSGGQWHEAGTLCSCGWRASVPTGAHTQTNILLAQSRHLTAVENGTWKPARPVGEIIDDVLKKVKDG